MVSNPGADLAGLHILVLMEDGGSYLSLKRQLNELGVTAVSRAQSPDEALAILRDAAVNMLITELSLPFVKYLRTSPRTPKRDLPIVVWSDCQSVRMVRAARDAGVDAYVSRDATPIQLGRHMRCAVRRDRRFIAGRSYAGPDRRRQDSIDYVGAERRGMAGLQHRLKQLDAYFPAA